MQLSVKGKQIDVGDSLRQYVETQLKEVIGKYFTQPLDAQVTFSREGQLFRADIAIHAGRGLVIQANATANEAYPAFDMAAERSAARLRRYKTRLKDHHIDASDESVMKAQSFVLNALHDENVEEAPANPVVVAEMTTTIETITVSEAVMRLDLGDLPALMFRNRANGGFNMIYRRADGHIGWVDPAQTVPEGKICG